MKSGVVAMLDALGFKGIWDREDPAAVVAQLHSAQAHEGQFDLHGFDAQFAFLSDTVVIACGFGDRPPIEALYYVCFRVGYFLESMLTCERPRLAYRGAIAAGKYLIDGTVILGEAIDNAAVSEKQAAGPVVWLTESATRLLPSDFAPKAEDAAQGAFFMMPFDVTMKPSVAGGERWMQRTFVVPPTVAVHETAPRLLDVVAGAPEKKEEAERLAASMQAYYLGWPLPMPDVDRKTHTRK